MSGPVSPLTLERYELKYKIPFEMVDIISEYIKPYCEMDYYSQISPNGFYGINSLYLDSPRLHILTGRENSGAYRFNIRIRSYGHDPKPPYFFEVKHKAREFVKKKRAKIDTENWAELLESSESFDQIDPISKKYLSHFVNLVNTYDLRPTILTQYSRRAFLSHIDDYARITFDAGLRFQYEDQYNLKPDERKMINYDHCDTFGEPGTNVILELKCERKIPVWFVDLIQRFNLVQTGFSKFAGSMVEAHGQNEYLMMDRIFPY